ncbi:MAG: hypothetical protein IE885_08820 [Campylobacterales bacterium]|nr:hypothetical protein [Campylobacterales bacterium]
MNIQEIFQNAKQLLQKADVVFIPPAGGIGMDGLACFRIRGALEALYDIL